MGTNATGITLRTDSEIALTAGGRINQILTGRGLDLTWLSTHTGVTIPGLLDATSSRMPMGLLYDIAETLNVSPAELLEETA